LGWNVERIELDILMKKWVSKNSISTDIVKISIVYPVLKHKIQLFKDLLLFDKILAALISSEYKYGAT